MQPQPNCNAAAPAVGAFSFLQPPIVPPLPPPPAAGSTVEQFRALTIDVVQAHGAFKLDAILASFGVDPSRVPLARAAEFIPALQAALAEPATLPPPPECASVSKAADWEVDDTPTTPEEYSEQVGVDRFETISDIIERRADARWALLQARQAHGESILDLCEAADVDAALVEGDEDVSDKEYARLYAELLAWQAEAERAPYTEADADAWHSRLCRLALGAGDGGDWLRPSESVKAEALERWKDEEARHKADPALEALSRRPDELVAAGASLDAVQAAMDAYTEALEAHRAAYPRRSLGLLLPDKAPTGSRAREFAAQRQRIEADPKLLALAQRADALSVQAAADLSKVGAWRAAVADFEAALNGAPTPGAVTPGVLTPARFAPLSAPAIKRKENGRVEPSHSNVFAALADPAFLGVLVARDGFRDEIMLSVDGGANWRPFTDADYSALHRALDAKGFVRVASEVLRACVNEVAERRRFDTADAWLRQHVPAHDGVPRVERFMSTHLGVADTPYSRAVGRYVWTALAGRVLSPGCKADMSVVLVGPQGSGKSSAIAALSPDPEFFAEINIGERDENLSRQLRGVVVAEIAELRGLATRDAESIKAFLTRTHEKWVPKYREFATSFPRRCLFFGSTNEAEFLSDPTGERRWLPVDIGAIKVEAIVADRLQLWAEAREMFERGGIDFREAETLARNEHAKFKRGDPWADRIAAWLDEVDADGVRRGDKPFTTADALGCAVGLSTAQQRSGEARRASGILRELGFTCDTNAIRTGRGRLRFWHKGS